MTHGDSLLDAIEEGLDESELESLPSLMQRLLREMALLPQARLPIHAAANGARPPALALTPPVPSAAASVTPPSFQPHHLCATSPAPLLRRLSKDAVLHTALVEWGGGGGIGCGAGVGDAAVVGAFDDSPLGLPRELRSSSLTQCGDHVDFIAPAENMKQFFKLLHTSCAISLAVHRVGDSLVLEGLEAEPWARGDYIYSPR